ncbi:MAG: SDR family oxidoreductase [Desulfobacteraceae bacterium]|nr:SDR family oxidoreductase [Desulfobacteraceae bacterium]
MNLTILGANSDVAMATARRFAQSKMISSLCLASRDLELLERNANDIQVRYDIPVKAVVFNALDYTSHARFYQQLDPKPDIVVLAFGLLGDQQNAQSSFEEAHRIIDSNFSGAVSILEVVAADFERRRQGIIIGISSVAGERGRQSNYIYGASKAALTAYLSGLRNRLFKSQVHVLTVLPGFINTKMNRHLQLPGLLTASPDDVANDIFKAYLKSKNLIYTLWFWRWIMAIIKSIPEPFFKKMSL